MWARLGDPAQAVVCYRKAVEPFPAAGDRYTLALALDGLGDSRKASGDTHAAAAEWRAAASILDQLDHPAVESVLAKLRTAESQLFS